MEMALNIALVILLMVMGIAVAYIRDLFAVVMLYGIYSALTACLFVVLDAVDVAFTEASVATGIATVLMLGALSLTGMRREQVVVAPNVAAILLAIAVAGVILMLGVLGMPDFADPMAPANLHVAPYYLEQTPVEIDIPNVVTAVLASYRGYDTLGEVVVIFTAGVGVAALLGAGRGKRGQG